MGFNYFWSDGHPFQ